MRPRTIMFVANAPFFSGAERALLVLLQNLPRDAWHPVVVVGRDGDLATAVRGLGIHLEHVPIAHTGIRSVMRWATSVAGMLSALLRHRPALVHVNDAPSFQPAGYAARLLRIPAVAHIRFPDTAAGFSWMLKPAFERAVFVSEALRSDAAAEAPDLFSHRTDVIYDGVMLPSLPEEVDRQRIRSDLGLPANRPVVALTGQVAEVKGIHEFVDAADVLTRRGVLASFAVLGDDLRTRGLVRRRMEERVAALGLCDRFHFLGFRANAPSLISAFDIVAVPSHVEPLGNATLEAMAAGKPVVGSRVGGIPEMIVDGFTGALIAPRDATALADGLQQLIADPQRARTLGMAGRARAADVFSVSAHVDRISCLYEDVLERQRPFPQASALRGA